MSEFTNHMQLISCDPVYQAMCNEAARLFSENTAPRMVVYQDGREPTFETVWKSEAVRDEYCQLENYIEQYLKLAIEKAKYINSRCSCFLEFKIQDKCE